MITLTFSCPQPRPGLIPRLTLPRHRSFADTICSGKVTRRTPENRSRMSLRIWSTRCSPQTPSRGDTTIFYRVAARVSKLHILFVHMHYYSVILFACTVRFCFRMYNAHFLFTCTDFCLAHAHQMLIYPHTNIIVYTRK